MARGERGAALVLVLWFTILLSLIAVPVARQGISDAKIAINIRDAAKAEAWADGGIALAVWALSRQMTDTPWPIDGVPVRIPIDGGTLQISITDEGRKINFLSVRAEELALAFIRIGWSEDAANMRASAIIDDRLKAREAARQRAVSGSLLRPVQVFGLGDIQWLADLSRDEYAAMRQHMTIFGGARARSTSQSGTVARARDAGNEAMVLQPRGRSQTYGLTILAELDAGARFERYAVIRMAPRLTEGYEILHWE